MTQIEKLKKCFYPIIMADGSNEKIYRKIYQADVCQDCSGVAVFLRKDSYSPHIISYGQVQKIIDESPNIDDLDFDVENDIYREKK